MKKVLSVLIAVAILLTACGQKNAGDEQSSPGKGEETDLVPLLVHLQVPKTARPGEEVVIRAVVTYGDEKVSDAQEVEFEIWKDDNKSQSEMMAAKNEGDGVYSVKKTFETEGTYSVTSHVTARGMHTMPSKTITVESP